METLDRMMTFLRPYIWPWSGVLLGLLLAWVLPHVALFILWQATGRNEEGFSSDMRRRLARPLSVIFPLLLIRLYLPFISSNDVVNKVIGDLLALCLIASVAWLLAISMNLIVELISRRFRLDEADNLHARKVHTQLRLIRRVVLFLIIMLTLGSMLMVFDSIRQLGTGILASAGVAGIVVGLAAQRLLSNLLLSIQFAITQPVRLDDVVVIDGEWGRIEELTSTYAVVRIWDKRRLIVPFTYFVDKPIQNWTRTEAAIIGSVFLYTDYTIPVKAVREQLQSILQDSPLWDGEVCNLVVANMKEYVVELRALMSAKDSSTAWDLRCHVREQLLSWLQQTYPDCLPQFRLEAKGKPEQLPST